MGLQRMLFVRRLPRRMSTLLFVLLVSILSTLLVLVPLHASDQVVIVASNQSAPINQSINSNQSSERPIQSTTEWLSHNSTNNSTNNVMVMAQDAQWQSVSGTVQKFFVYSAFLDNRSERLIRIIGVAPTKKADQVLCRVTFNDSVLVIQAKVKVIKENWNLRYSAIFVLCHLNDIQAIPQFVSVISSNNEARITNSMPILNQQSSIMDFESAKYANASSLGVCVKPLHFTYNRSWEILEFLEINRLLGVKAFVFYKESVSEEVKCLLEMSPDVKLLSWSGLNVTSKTEIRTEGIFAALNDCLYREMYKFDHLMFIDIDEIVVPNRHESIPQLIESVRSKSLNRAKTFFKHPNSPRADQSLIASYIFSNVFFYRQFGDDYSFYENWNNKNTNNTNNLSTDNKDNLEKSQISNEDSNEDTRNRRALPMLLSLLKTRRSSKTFPPRNRSKYIVVSALTREVGNHFVWEHFRGVNVNVEPKVAKLHHYRVCEFGGDDCVKAPSITDRRLPQLLGTKLIKTYSKEQKRLDKICKFRK